MSIVATGATATNIAQLNSWLMSGNLESWQKVIQSTMVSKEKEAVGLSDCKKIKAMLF